MKVLGHSWAYSWFLAHSWVIAHSWKFIK